MLFKLPNSLILFYDYLSSNDSFEFTLFYWMELVDDYAPPALFNEFEANLLRPGFDLAIASSASALALAYNSGLSSIENSSTYT